MLCDAIFSDISSAVFGSTFGFTKDAQLRMLCVFLYDIRSDSRLY